MSRTLKVVFWLALAMGLWVALTPNFGPRLPEDGPYDKIQHFVGFYILALLGLAAYPALRRWLFAGLLAYGALIEVLQAIPALNREAEWGDLVADALGILAAIAPTLLPRQSKS